MAVFRILAIDGGGIRGVIPAVFLQELEKVLGPLDEHFQLIAGTSTGAIIAAALAAGKTPAQIVELYRKRGREIFPYRHRWSPRRLGLLFEHGPSAPKYDPTGLRDLLRAEFDTLTVESVNDRVRLLIPFYDTISRSAEFIKSYPTKTQPVPKFGSVPLWEAALCSSSAPTFFPAHDLTVGTSSYSAIDGGVAANNPVACALADALESGQKLKDIRIVSLGTGTNTRRIELDDAQEWGAAEWAVPIIDVLMDGATNVARYVVEQAVGEANIVRLQFRLDAREWKVEPLSDDMDDASPENVASLAQAARKYLKQQAAELEKARFP